MAKRTAVSPIEADAHDASTPALRVQDLIFVSAQGPIDLVTGRVAGSTIHEQAERAMENLAEVLNAAGSNVNDCVRLTVYLADLNDREGFDQVYRRYFRQPLPARSVVQAAPLAGKVQLDAIAMRGSGG